MTALFTALVAFAIGLGVDAIPQYDTPVIEYAIEYIEEQDIQQDIPAPYIADGDIPEWVHTEWHHGEDECGCCGAALTEWRTIRNYYNTTDVSVCADCWEWARSESIEEHRAVQEFLAQKTGREIDMVGITDEQRDEVQELLDEKIEYEREAQKRINGND